jgi:hypothetical protein
MSQQEELDRRMRSWRMELLALGSRSPKANGSVSSGVYHAHLELTETLFLHRVITIDEMDDDMRKIWWEVELRLRGRSP